MTLSIQEPPKQQHFPGKIWRLPVTLRRIFFFASVTVLALSGILLFLDLILRLYGRLDVATGLLVFLFSILFSLVCFGVTIAVTGFLLMGYKGVNITNTLSPADEEMHLDLTAVIFPIYNEDVSEVFNRIRGVYRSLTETGRIERYEFFILSDSTKIDVWIEEEEAWTRLCRDLGGFGRIFYRHRSPNTNSKAGNIADFCRRWGGRYSYLVVMDADSFMDGQTMLKLTMLMQKNPEVGIIQTAPKLVGATSLFGRVQQFAIQAYGPMFTAGLNFWQASEGNYWGHNAIIRLQPFTAYCDLPQLPGKEPFGGKILSHDFVEAALMRKAGWKVWLAWDLEGSYEEGPDSLIAYAQRDRRWLQGNLQHAWFLFAKGLHPISKVHLGTGILGYLLSPLWLLFLILSALIVYRQEQTNLSIIPDDGWINYFDPFLTATEHAWLLFCITAAMLLTPKILLTLWALFNRRVRHGFGGLRALGMSIGCEFILSTLLAPILMLFHTKFIVSMFSGLSVRWGAQARGATTTSWGAAFQAHFSQTVIGIVWAVAAYKINYQMFLWSLPVLTGLVTSIPLSRFTSNPAVGNFLRRWKVLQAPQETSPAVALAPANETPGEEAANFDPYHGFSRAIVDPYLNAIHVSLQEDPGSSSIEGDLLDKIAVEGPAALKENELKMILKDGESMLKLHRRVWTSEFMTLSPWWRNVVTQYRR